ncbi:MAG: HEAT repeat domain-containing protein [Myxococcota bacterium]
MWWIIATAVADPGVDAALATALDAQASTKARTKAIRELGRLDPEHPEVPSVVTPLAAELRTELPGGLSAAIRKTLGRLDAPSIWTVNLTSPDATTRRTAADLLGHEGSAPAGPALVAVLDDPVASVRAAAAGALVAYPATDSVGPLSERLKDPALAVRLAASQTLGFLGGDVAFRALAQARATESDAVVKHYLDAAMGHISRQERPR